ncbi:MAG: hypothetical protein GX075_05395 [Firmicutes bacterium]|nr:hypothetical protein [Bacillota bacterium]
MAGYVVNLNSLDSLQTYIFNGVYATILSAPRNYWAVHHEATFADYVSMKPGDNIYFFINRKIYGIGELVAIGDDCKFLNYPKANIPSNFDYNAEKSNLLWDEGKQSVNQRWLCVFKPNPYFFKYGIDMDEVLASNPSKFRMLRVFWKVSFIKFDDEENKAFIDVILKANQETLKNPDEEKIFLSDYQNFHSSLRNKIGEMPSAYTLKPDDILLSCADGQYLKHEMALEAGLLYQLFNKEPNTTEIFGSWDYLSHQVIASPFKPVDYMDKMDVFGYAFISGYRTIAKYLVVELKKDQAVLEDIEQVMKYVDWVKDEYAYGDYSMISAFLLAYDFGKDVVQYAKEAGMRKYIIGRRPSQSVTWANLNLVRYRFDKKNCIINFEKVT